MTLQTPKARVDLRAVSSAALVQHNLRGNIATRLDLICKNKRHTINITQHMTTQRGDTDKLAHSALVQAIVEKLAEQSPDMPIAMEEYGRARTSMFAVGVLSLLGGAGLLIAILATVSDFDKTLGALLPTGLLALFGLALMFGNAPWRPIETVSAQILAKALRDA